MTKMNPREKNLALAVLTVALLTAWHFTAKNMDGKIDALSGRLEQLAEQRKQAEAALHTAENLPKVPSGPDAGSSIALLGDLTASSTAAGVKIVSVERSSEKSFKVVLEAGFVDMMHLLGSLERAEGSLSVSGGELLRPAKEARKGVTETDDRPVRAVLNLFVRGKT